MHLFNGGRAALLALYLTLTVALAAIPSSKRFDLSKPSYNLFRSKSLHENRLRDGTGATSGDLCITQLDFSGKYLGYMHLNGFGHGVTFGAQGTRDGATYLWTEVEANGNGEHTAFIDQLANRLVVRYQHKGGKHIAAFDLDAAARGDFANPLVNFPQPVLDKFKSKVFQGYAAHGSYLYIMTGTSYEASDGEVNSQVASIDMNTGKIVQGPTLTNAGSSLPFREPEGMGVYKTKAGEVRFFLGFATGKRGDRRSSLFYKDALI
ncbi:teichoic acid biosynthesis protein C [Blastomyces gilchristii SLH14081]|uniref:Teichoic acid biosynthesis protein C n=1 Tax=Blastomyces gilchristii (strain SLH14081) TaxID=559298 RepID=A0A179V190_BLAGS|nr:teichoic acid biosynthesis protein C [Blastomyces gilchristii SLH14081]OAT13188.1 teichoic acid biosynthesis protein C [Blastomyces gilchristii SLH14081]